MRCLMALVLWAAVGLTGCGVRPLPGAFAHNDYEHQRPLLDALSHGFTIVEADVFLEKGQLLVGHDREDLRPDRTLQSLYLEPLRRRIERMGSVYGDGTPFVLMIDIKSDAEPTYAAIRSALATHRAMLTTWPGGTAAPGPVTIILSGNRAKETIAAQADRLVAIDGRLEDLDADPPPELVPWISAPWDKSFTWTGHGPMPSSQRLKLRDRVRRTHAQGRRIRFWGTPDRIEVWRELQAAGVDLLNTDDLPGLARFLRENPP